MRFKKKRSQVAQGYRPDAVVVSKRDRVKFIIEFETTPSRKTIVGDLVKAEKYSQEKQVSPILVIVLHERSNTTSQQIRDHVEPYFEWLKRTRRNSAGLRKVYVLPDNEYKDSVIANEPITSGAFRKRCCVAG